MLCALCSILLLLSFPRAQSLLYVRSSILNYVCTMACPSLHAPVVMYRMFFHKTACILFALLLYFYRTESANGLHSETSGLPRLAGLQSYRKPVWCYPALLQDVECTSAGCFLASLCCLSKLSLTSAILQYAFLLSYTEYVWDACYIKSISRALTKEYSTCEMLPSCWCHFKCICLKS